MTAADIAAARRTVRVYNAPDPSAGPQAECTLRAVLRSDVPDWHTLTYMSLETGGGGDRVACATQHGYVRSIPLSACVCLSV